MLGEILKIKTNIPPLGTNILSRPRILERLNEDLMTTVADGFNRRMTLVSAPAGFGKTTLIRKWLDKHEGRAAWYSLDEGDNEQERFWIYLISALQTVTGSIGTNALEILRLSSQSLESPVESKSLLTSLLNDLFTLEKPFFLVLDDYHLINNSLIHEDMIFFIDNLPPSIHLAVTTRSDPPWPSFRWRAKGQMLEVRLNDLKFSEEEAGRLFARLKSPGLTERQLHTLYNKTEGWITGLQLAAFSLAAGSNADEFIKSFAGSHRHVLHFLSEEVFIRQPENVRNFLLQTSVLSRFCASLCNMVTGRDDSAEVLAALERDNVFVIAMDDRGTWYRYHPLFSDLLFHQLKRSSPGIVPGLQEKAINWFLEAGEPGEAVRHALMSNNYKIMGRILHDYYDEILQKDGSWQINQCLDKFPMDLLKQYPRLTAQTALYNLVFKGKEEAKVFIDLAENLKYEHKKDQEEFSGLLAAIKTCYHVYTNNFPQALKSAEKALKYLSARNYYWRMNVAIYSGDARLFSGNPKDAYPFYLEAHQNSQKLNNHYFSLTTGFKAATSLYYRGRLNEAMELTRKLLQMARDKGLSKVPRVGLLWALLGELLREKGELAEAEQCIERGLFFSEPEKPSLGWNNLFRVALSFSRRNYQKALQAIREIEADNLKYKLPDFITLPAAIWQGRVLLAAGEVSAIRETLSRAGITDETEMQAGQESGYLLLARLWLMTGSQDDYIRAKKLSDHIEELTTRHEHKRLLLETLLLKARLEEKRCNRDTAEHCLLSALQTGKEAGYYQLFKDEGRELAAVFFRIIERLKSQCPPDPGHTSVSESASIPASVPAPASDSAPIYESASASTSNNDLLNYIRRICLDIFPEMNIYTEKIIFRLSGENRENGENREIPVTGENEGSKENERSKGSEGSKEIRRNKGSRGIGVEQENEGFGNNKYYEGSSENRINSRNGGERRSEETEPNRKTGEKPEKSSGKYHHDLVEQLSSRELEVLDLISRGLSNQDIADKLFISLGTVKWHTSNIYGKLGVRGRTRALARARELGLLP